MFIYYLLLFLMKELYANTFKKSLISSEHLIAKLFRLFDEAAFVVKL